MATTYTHIIGSTYKTDAGTIASPVTTYTAHGQEGWEGTVAVSTTNHAIALPIDVSSLYSLCIYSSSAVTIKTNSTGSPDDTLTVAAGQAIIWAHDYTATCPLTADVTTFYVTNASSTIVATVKFEFLLNI